MCLVVLQADWVTMNYVPFGEKALTMVVNLYQQTAHDMSVIQFNILHNIIEVCYSLLVSMLCKVNYSTNPVVCLLICLFLCVKDVAFHCSVCEIRQFESLLYFSQDISQDETPLTS